MNASLPDLQRRFAASLRDANADPRMRVYRSAIAANYRNALGATYPVVRELTGTPFFNTAVDTFAAAHPSTSGDLNAYGSEFAQFLAAYPHARELAYLPDVARLEWALDEAARARDAAPDPEAVIRGLGEVPGEALVHQRFALDPSCRFVQSAYPVMRIWQVHQSDGDKTVDLDAGADYLVVRREDGAASIARVAPADFAFLAALAQGSELAAALDAAVAADAGFDVGASLRAHIGDGTIASLA